MTFLWVSLLLLIFFATLDCYRYEYSRAKVQEELPGFGEKYMLLEDDDGNVRVGFYKEAPTTHSKWLFGGNLEDITFTLFNSYNRNGVLFNKDNITYAKFDPSKKLKIVTHGWLSSGKAETCISIKDNFLKKYDTNVIILDWGAISKNIFYPIPMGETKHVGNLYAKALDQIVEKNNLNPSDIHLVGHSLGAHVSGFAAKHSKYTIGRITGLDPAKPGFVRTDEKLDKTQADFVDVIHTCAGFLGLDESLGHVDFYPNGGSPPQPGCWLTQELIESCSHGMSWKYFASSITSPKPFTSYKCTNFTAFLDKVNCHETTVQMGEPLTKNVDHGSYYLVTAANSPFVMTESDNYIDQFQLD